jgi:hypothetical protein
MKAVPEAPFIRCDANGDAILNVADAVWMLSALFQGGGASKCREAFDCDHNGNIQIADAVYLLNHLFLGGTEPGAPYPTCGRVRGLSLEDCPLGSSNCR